MATDLPQSPPTPTADYWPGNAAADADPAAAASPTWKRAGPKKKDVLARYRQRVQTSLKWRKDEGYDDTWRRLIDLYRNKQFASSSPQSDQIAVNVAFSTINTIAPSVAVNYPNITVNARQQQEQPAADTAGSAVNYWWRHFDWRDEVKTSVKDSLITGNGWVKVGWKYQTSGRPLTEAEQRDALEDAKQNASDQAAQDPANAPAAPTDEELQSQIPTETYEVEVDEPFVERASPFDIVIDPEATNESDLKWIAQRLVVPIDDVRNDTRYNAAARNSITPDKSTNIRWRDAENGTVGADKNYSDDVQRVTLWEFYDMRSALYCVFAENGGENFLVDPTDFPYPYGSPFVYLPCYSVPDQFYAIGELEAIEPLQLELNAVRSDMMNHRKRWNRAYLVRRDALDKPAQNALLSDVDNRIIPIDGDVELDKIVVPLQQVGLDAQMYQYSELIESDVDLVSGVSEYQRGSQSEIRRTATEAAMIQDASNARASDKLAEIEVFMASIARRVVQLAQTYLTGDENFARIVGPNGVQTWSKFDREAIQGEFDFETEAGSTQPRDESFKRQQALQLANVLAPYVEGGTVDPKALVTYVLEQGFGVTNASDFLAQQEAPSGPTDKMIETINYKDAPPDIQRQMEQAAGMTPSALGPNAAPGQSIAGGSAPAGGGGAEGGGAPGTGPTDAPQLASALPTSGMNIPAAELHQLAGQVGLDLHHGG